MELPPRARRIPTPVSVKIFALGTTSACAENTKQTTPPPPPRWNYLRVRGEYWKTATNITSSPELPPRARRILLYDFPWGSTDGTTSACAENTGDQGAWGASHGNYLRVRGEYRFSGIPQLWGTGTTSACAENTPLADYGKHKIRNYLRVRGEYSSMSPVVRFSRELPPRARRIHPKFRLSRPATGTTSACAENTNHRTTIRSSPWNYLRVRGEYK